MSLMFDLESNGTVELTVLTLTPAQSLTLLGLSWKEKKKSEELLDSTPT